MQEPRNEQRLVDRTIGELAAENPALVAVFDKLGFDYCCTGNEILSDACRRKGLNEEAVTEALLVQRPETGLDHWDSWAFRSTSEIIVYVQDVYHASLARDLPHLVEVCERIVTIHEGRSETPYLFDLLDHLRHFAADMVALIARQRAELFPALLNPKRRLTPKVEADLKEEGQRLNAVLRKIRLITAQYEPPFDACMTQRTLWLDLAEMDLKVHRQTHLVSNILWPRLHPLVVDH